MHYDFKDRAAFPGGENDGSIAQFLLGRLNVVAALTIAGGKMFLVIYCFMHLRHANKLTWLFVAGGFIGF